MLKMNGPVLNSKLIENILKRRFLENRNSNLENLGTYS